MRDVAPSQGSSLSQSRRFFAFLPACGKAEEEASAPQGTFRNQGEYGLTLKALKICFDMGLHFTNVSVGGSRL